MSDILFAGEQYTILEFETKGFDFLGVGGSKRDGEAICRALAKKGHRVSRIDTSHVPRHFPETMAALRKFDVVVLSDVGANSLLLHPDMAARSERHPNRLKLLRDYVRGGGGLLMIGGWMSFAGIEGKAKFYNSILEDALPVRCLTCDDREERPEGVAPSVEAAHPILAGIPKSWPFFLGYNKVVPKEEAQVLLAFEKDPLLVVWEYGKGRAAAFTSDCAPHWAPPEFLNWRGYAPFWGNLAQWLAGKGRGRKAGG